MFGKKITSEKMWEEISQNETALEYAILLLYKQQTNDEKETLSTNHNNNKGFNGGDSFFMSRIAEKIKERLPLNSYEVLKARTRIRKYVNQITKIHNGKFTS